MVKKGGSKGGSKGGPKGKQEKVKKEGKKLSALYEISGDSITRKNRTCPKCGPGMFLGKHKNRLVCGKCQYVEFMGKKEEPKEEKTEEKPAEEEKAEEKVEEAKEE